MKKVIVKLYLYFDAQESKIKNRIADINHRILRADEELSVSDINELYELKIKYDTYLTIEKHLLELLE